MQPQFIASLYQRCELSSYDEDDGRRYILPDGRIVDSVTTILGKSNEFPKSWLKKWRNRVGNEVANKIITQAQNRGSAIHAMAEQYLLGNSNYATGNMPVNIEDFNSIKPYLDQNVREIKGIEIPLYSYELLTAGRADLIATWNNQLSIIDFKTSKKLKKETDILNYFVQASTYAYMATEMYEPIRQIVILIMVSNELPQVFVRTVKDYLPLVQRIFCP